MRIEELELSERSMNCLRRAGIRTVEQIAGMDSQELLSLRGLGEGCLREINKAVAASGVEAGKREIPADGSYLHGYREGVKAQRAAAIKSLIAEAKQYRGAIRTGILVALETVRETEVSI